MLKNWTNIFIYHIKNNKLFTALNVLGLSIGIAGLIFATLYWNDEQSYNQWNPNKDNIFLLANQMSENTFWASSSAPIGSAIKEVSPEIESFCYLSGNYDNDIIRFNNKKVQSDHIIVAQKNFFDYFPYEFIEGSQKAALPDVNSICLSKDLAFQIFGNEAALGKQIILQGKSLVVRGVYKLDKKSLCNPSCVVNFMDERVNNTIQQWGNFQFVLLLKLKNANDQEQVVKRMQKIYFANMTAPRAKAQGMTAKEFIQKFGEVKAGLEPLSSIRLHTKTGGIIESNGNYQFLIIMVGLSILILTLSIVNYVNSATANAVKRAKEVGVRKIIGASKSAIIQQFIFETAIISLVSILISLVIVELTIPYYNAFLEKNLVLQSSQFYLQLVAIFFVTVLLAGIFPAIYIANFEPLKVLKGNFGRSKSGVWLRNGMLIFQFAIAAFFIIGSHIVYQQIQYLQNKDLGFKGDQVLTIPLNIPLAEYTSKNAEQTIYTKYNTLKQELGKIKGVEQISTGLMCFDGSDNSISPVLYNNELFKERGIALDYGLLEMLNVKMKEGRNFDRKLASDTVNSVIINESALNLMKLKNPIGKELLIRDQKLKIIGIVKDFNLLSPELKVPPIVFYHIKTFNMAHNINRVYIKIKSDNLETTIKSIEKLWAQVDTEYPFRYDFVDKEYARTYESYIKQKNLFSLLNIVVILIALFGLFALASYSIQRRMKEIAIRKVLGAETNVLLKELSKQYVLYCIVGFLIALFPVYYLLNKWLENFAFRIDISIIPFVLGFVILLFLTLIIVLSRAYAATKTDILKYLKYE